MIDLKEAGKWLLDIAKYVITAGIAASFFRRAGDVWLMYLAGVATAMILWFLGMYLIHKSKNKTL